MNLLIIENKNNSHIVNPGFSSGNAKKIKGELLIERIIRIGRNNGVSQILCAINSHEPELKSFLSTNNFGIPIKIIEVDKEISLINFAVIAPSLSNDRFVIINKNSVFTENEFSEFLSYSILQDDADGVIAVARYDSSEKPYCVAMNDEDIILKFSKEKDGYSWATGGIYYFKPRIFNELKYALNANIVGIEKYLQLLIIRGYILKGFSFNKIIRIKNDNDIVRAEEMISLYE